MNRHDWIAEAKTVRKGLKDLIAIPLPSPVRDGAWSSREVFHHVLLANTGAQNLLERLITKAGDLAVNKEPTVWPVRSGLNTLPFDRAFSVPAFKGTEPDSAVTLETLEKLEADEAKKNERFLEYATQYDCEALSFPHPLVGTMNFYEWLCFNVIHERLHFEKLKSDLG